MLFYPSDTRVQLVCHTDWRGMILPFAPVLALMAVCTYYAVLTRYTENIFRFFLRIYDIYLLDVIEDNECSHYLLMSMAIEMMAKSHLLDLRHPRLVVKINNF